MSRDLLKIPKKLRPVTLWVHPEGRVIGSLFLRRHSSNFAGEEEPFEVLNHANEFLVMKREDPEELRFYNKASIVRLEYDEAAPWHAVEAKPLSCALHMMDGSLIAGQIKKAMPPDHARLLDYLNLENERFVKIHLEDGKVHLINKSYIVCITTVDEA